MISREAVVATARTQIGVKWQHQACLMGVALDCIGLIAGTAVVLGIPQGWEWLNDQRYRGYGPTPNAKLLIEASDTYMDRIELAEAGLGDVLVMAFYDVVKRSFGAPQHFAFISRLDPHYLIHSYAQARKVVENGINVANAKVLRAYRLRGVA